MARSPRPWSAPLGRLQLAIAERPALEVDRDATIDLDQTPRLEQQEADDRNPDRRLLDAEGGGSQSPRRRKFVEEALDPERKQGHEHRAEHRSRDRAHAADDDHGEIEN